MSFTQLPITKEENKPDTHPVCTELHQFIPGEYLTSTRVRSKALIYAVMTNCTKLRSVTVWLFLVHFLKIKIISSSDNFKEKKKRQQSNGLSPSFNYSSPFKNENK